MCWDPEITFIFIKIVAFDSHKLLQVTFAPRPGRTEAHRVTLLGWDRSQVALAWATTVHKAQGGEFPAVVVVLHQDMARECQGGGLEGGGRG